LLKEDLKQVIVVWKYEKVPKQIMENFKYNYITDLGFDIRMLISSAFTEYCHSIEQKYNKPVCIVPIPLSRARLKQRGFNQIDLFVKDLVHYPHIYKSDFLIRNFDNYRQAHLPKELRQLNSENLFVLNAKYRDEVKMNVPILIVDDVITTGATLRAATETLTKSGFTEIYGFALFRGKARYGRTREIEMQ
jgi:ComF family protein